MMDSDFEIYIVTLEQKVNKSIKIYKELLTFCTNVKIIMAAVNVSETLR